MRIQVAASPSNQPAPPPIGFPPLLKWAGGKSWLVPRLHDLYSRHRDRMYCEPFAGGLAAALGLTPGKAIISDLNPHVVNFYTQVCRGLRFTLQMKNDEDSYYSRRDQFNKLVESNHALSPRGAQLFYYLNKTGFNGLCRLNKSGGYNVPFGEHSSIRYSKDLSLYRTVMSDWTFIASSFEAVTFPRGSFVYADPPYDGKFDKYCGQPFTWEQQVELAQNLASHPGPAVASNAASPRVLELYRDLGFDIEVLDAPRRISCTGDRTPVKEMLASQRV